MPAPVQLYVTPDVVELALMLPLIAVQVSVSDGPAVTSGKAPVLVTTTVAVVVQVLAGSVTVTVYVPAALTVGEDVVPPETMPAPDQL